MATIDLVARLASHRIVGDVPPGELEWVAAHGELRHMEVGEVISSPKLGAIEHMFILLSGSVGFYRDRGGAQRRVIEWRGGDITGFLPYSRMTTSPGEGRVEEACDVVLVHRDRFPDMVRECPVLTGKLVWVMIDRARHFQKDDLQRERLVSLGKLAAGLAHELDNPTSAALRSSRLLGSLLKESDDAARALGEIGIPPDQLARIEGLRQSCLTDRVQQVRSPLEQARREEAIADWLEERRVSGVSVEALADAPIGPDALDTVAGMVDRRALEPALRWLAAGCALLSIAAEIQHASKRTSELVKAVKGFSQVDRAAAIRPVDVQEGLMQTLTMLRSKARSKSAQVDLTVEPDLPRVPAVGGELNQVWHNLIDNALDAVGDGGIVKVSAKREGNSVVVCVEDNGPGIPPEVQERMFEPFFTTKPVGQGTGLGLDIVGRLVDGQNGSLDFSSTPGRTSFRVMLPVAGGAGEGTTS
jgi:signal transduction histidine kinase